MAEQFLNPEQQNSQRVQIRVASNNRDAENSKDSRDVSSRGENMGVNNSIRYERNITHSSDRDACNIMNFGNRRGTLAAAVT
jgi:hypothetical protein